MYPCGASTLNVAFTIEAGEMFQLSALGPENTDIFNCLGCNMHSQFLPHLTYELAKKGKVDRKDLRKWCIYLCTVE